MMELPKRHAASPKGSRFAPSALIGWPWPPGTVDSERRRYSARAALSLSCPSESPKLTALRQPESGSAEAGVVYTEGPQLATPGVPGMASERARVGPLGH